MHAYECLIPRPTTISPAAGEGLRTDDVRFELVGCDDPRLAKVLGEFAGGRALPVRLDLAPDGPHGDEGYRLEIADGGATIEAGSVRGLFYGLHTLRQLVLLCENDVIPPLVVEDRPEFAVRGLHLDLRCQKLRPEYLARYVAELGSYKINTVTFEWEDTFPFGRTPEVAGPYHYTREEVGRIISACEENFITAVPLLQTIGHVEYILRNEVHASLREDHRDLSQYCLTNPDVLPFICGLIDEVADAHPGPLFHMGGDETRLLGHCPRCAEHVAASSQADLYARHAAAIAEHIVSIGKTPVLWADIATKHPEMLPQLPDDIIFQDWRYSYDSGIRYETLSLFQPLGLRFQAVGCGRGMSDSEWHYEYDRIFGNLRELARQAKQAGAEGFGSSSWSTNGVMDFLFTREGEIVAGHYRLHRYPIPGNVLGVLACAEHAWNAGQTETEDWLARVPRLVFGVDDGAIVEGVMDGKYEVFFLEHSRENAQRCRQGWETLRGIAPRVRRNQETFEHLAFMARGHAHMAQRKVLFHDIDQTWGRDAEAFERLRPQIDDFFAELEALRQEHRRIMAPYFDSGELDIESRLIFLCEDERAWKLRRSF
jgi:hexosaminidase